MKRIGKITALITLFALLATPGGSSAFAKKPRGGGGGPSPTPNSYVVDYFGPLPGGTYTYPLGMNNHAEVVGRADRSDGWPCAFVYSPANGIVDLNDQFRADGLAAPDGTALAFDSATGTGWLVGWCRTSMTPARSFACLEN